MLCNTTVCLNMSMTCYLLEPMSDTNRVCLNTNLKSNLVPYADSVFVCFNGNMNCESMSTCGIPTISRVTFHIRHSQRRHSSHWKCCSCVFSLHAKHALLSHESQGMGCGYTRRARGALRATLRRGPKPQQQCHFGPDYAVTKGHLT